MIENNKYLLTCRQGHQYVVTLGEYGNFTCRVCGMNQVKIEPLVITKEMRRVSKNVQESTEEK